MPVRSLAFTTLLGTYLCTMTSREGLAQKAPHKPPVVGPPVAQPLILCQSQIYAVAVTPHGGTASRTQYTVGDTSIFTVQNTSVDCAATFSLSHKETGPIMSVTLNKTSVTLNPGISTTVVATYDVGSQGSGVLTLAAVANPDPSVSDTGYFTVTAVSDAPTNWDVTPFNYDNQVVGRCTAACFAATYAQATVPYFSLDAPRNATLAYNSDRVWPKPFVHLNVQKPSGSTPDTIFLQIRKAGVWQTFINGDSLLKFLAAPSGWQRIGGQLGDSTWATGMYTVDIVVTWHYPGGSTNVQTWTTKMLVVNEASSPIARGWTIVGLQRIYPQADGSVLVTEGDGSAVFFRKRTTPAFFSPTGEFSTLVVNGTGWKRSYPDSTTVFFNSAGRATDIYDRFGNRTQFFYDASNRDTTIRDPNSQDVGLAYGAYGLSSIRDNITPYRYTNLTVLSDSTLAAIQDPDGVSSGFQYDGSRRLWKVISRRGDTTTIAYLTINGKMTGKLVSVTGPQVPIFGQGTVSPVTSYSPWQTVGVPYSTTASAPAPVVLPDTVYGRDTDAGGHTTQFTVNHWGSAAVTTDAIGRTDSTRFDSNGLPIRLKSPAGAVDTIVYNALGLVTYAKSGSKPAVLFRYTGWAQPDSIWTDDGLLGAFYFIGANGRIDSSRVAGGTPDAGTTRYTYEAHGRIASQVDPLQHSVQSTQYAGTNGNRTQDALPGNRVSSYGYDAYGRVTTLSRSGYATTTMYYSVMNRADSVRDGVSPVASRFAYDNLFPTSVTDPKGQVYSLTYNAFGWLRQRTDPIGNSDLYEYDRDGELRRWTNRRGQTVDYLHDALHRRTSKSGTNTATESWAYPNDTVMVSTSPMEVDTTVANQQGQLIRVSTVLDGQNYVRRYHYTASEALDSVLPSGGGITFQNRHYGWNVRRGTLDTIALSTATTVLGHDIDALRTGWTLPGGDVVTRSSNSVHFTADFTTTAPYSASVNRSSGFDAAGRVVRQITSSSQGHQYSYDGLSRLIADSLIQSNGTPCNPHNPPNDNGDPCTFDPSWSALPSGATTFSYDSAGNRRDLGGIYTTGNRISAFNGCTYSTDVEGNVTGRTCGSQNVIFTWTAENRLASLTVSSQTTTFDYNAEGRLVRMSKPGLVRHFLWERDNLLAELDSVGTGEIAEYSYYPGLDNPHALIVGNTKYFVHRDMRRNVVALTDASMSLARTYEYTPFGVFWNGSDYANLAGKDRARFKGALSFGDVLGDLYYMRNRWYEPGTGRFLSEDPLGVRGGLNPLVYGNDDPVNTMDPLGLDPACPQGYTEQGYFPNAAYDPGDGTGPISGSAYLCKNENGDVLWVFVPSLFQNDKNLDPISVETTQCKYCWPESVADRRARIRQVLETFRIEGERETFALGGFIFTLHANAGPNATNSIELIQQICKDARQQMTLGNFGALSAGVLATLDLVWGRKAVVQIGGNVVRIDDPTSELDLFDLMEASGNLVVQGYAIRTGIGC